ncbi:MAG: WYL domain-containing protein [Bacteroidetes bacterium]|nr:WYL domain-containing protein [Bacteroidota bacterium]
MSKIESIARYNLIINKLRKYPASFKEILSYLEIESDIQGYNYSISLRTFQRDIEDISIIYNIDIKYDFSRKAYYIDYDEDDALKERLFEAFDTYNALKISERLSEYIHFEKRKPQGTENLYGLLNAIKNKMQVSFDYCKFWNEKTQTRLVEPYILKEFKNRWYVFALDIEDGNVKSFGLDRLSNLEIKKKKFKPLKDFDVNAYFKNCFGIISANDDEPKEIVLSFEPLQGKYIKTLPLHHSQEIVVDNKKEFRIKLKLFVTYDFIMELLSHGDRVKVIEPKSLIKQMKDIYTKALKQY